MTDARFEFEASIKPELTLEEQQIEDLQTYMQQQEIRLKAAFD
jgi:hypothetical protein